MREKDSISGFSAKDGRMQRVMLQVVTASCPFDFPLLPAN